MTANHVVAASEDTVYVWNYRAALVKQADAAIKSAKAKPCGTRPEPLENGIIGQPG